MPYAIAFQLMPGWGERFAWLRPPDSLAPGGYQPVLGSAGFLSGFTNMYVAGAFTAAVYRHRGHIAETPHATSSTTWASAS